MTQNVYLIAWYGPFKSLEEIKTWERSEDSVNSNLYLIQGKKKFAKDKISFYCGMTERTASRRLNDRGHHINEFSRISSIYVGVIDNKNSIAKKEILLVENMITAYLSRKIEKAGDVKGDMLNRTNFSLPNVPIYLINEWVDPYTYNTFEHKKGIITTSLIPDVMIYYANYNAIYGSNSIRKLHSLE